jgi:hypothetical protein
VSAARQLLRRLSTGRVAWGSDGIDVRRPFPLALMGIGLVAVLLGLAASPFLIAVGALVLVIGTLGFTMLRLIADRESVTVRNWLARRRLAWADVAEVRLKVARLTGTCVEVVLESGDVLRPGATRQTRLAYSAADLDEIVRRLETLRRDCVGGGDPPDERLRTSVGAATVRVRSRMGRLP